MQNDTAGARSVRVPRGGHVSENRIKFALLVAFGTGFSGVAAEPVEIDVTVIDYRFVPDRLSFQHGVHYRLHLVSKGRANP
jgi:hypothetical protein